MSLAGLALVLAACRSEPEERPSVLLVVLDALHAGHVSHLGYERETTPNLDRLASEGLSFEHAFAHAPYTLASIPSLFTGRLPEHHGLVDKGYVLPESERTIAEHLARHGYDTLGVVANLNGSELFDLDQGFDGFLNLLEPTPERPATYENPRTGESFHEAKAEAFEPVLSSWLAEGFAVDRPALLYLHVLEPHSPYTPPEPWFSRWLDPEYSGPLGSGDTESLVATTEPDTVIAPEDRAAAIALYDANLAYVDAELARWLDLLREHGIYDRTLVLVTSDHGEAFWQHGMWGHNETLYDEMLRVPLVVKPPAALMDASRWPWPEPGTRPNLPVGLSDVLPGLCDWLGLPLPDAELDGMSLAKLVHTEGLERKLVARTNHYQPSISLRDAREKTIVHLKPVGTPLEAVEHYRLDEDPDELVDVSPGLSESWRAQVILFAEALFTEGSARRMDRGRPLTTGEEAMLRRLGYTD